MSRIKKIILIIIFILLIAGIGFAVYYFFFRPAPPVAPVTPPAVPGVPTKLPARPAAPSEVVPLVPPAERPQVSPPAIPQAPAVAPILPQLPEASAIASPDKEILINTLVTKPVSGLSISNDGSAIVFYDKGEGKFYKMDAMGNRYSFSDKKFYDVQNITWASSKNKAILEYPDGSKIFYDFQKEKQVTLPNNWQEFSFSPAEDKIAFKTESADSHNRWLAVANPDGTEVRAIEAMGDNADKVQVSWSPNSQIIATSRTGQAQGAWQQEVLLIGLHGENYKSLIVSGQDFQYQWSPQGNKLLYSVYSDQSDYKPSLWVVNAQGDSIGKANTSLNLNTWSDKCVFSGDNKTVYCAVPDDLPEGSGMVKDLAEYSTDSWYKIDVESGVKSPMTRPTGSNAVNPFLSSDEKYLYFTDRYTGSVGGIQLK